MFAITVVSLAIQSSVAMRLLGILNGGIFRKDHRRTLQGKQQWPYLNQVLEETLMPTANITQLGSVGKANILSAITKDNTWIIDTGASDHMIRDSSKLQHLHLSSQQVISTANGGTSPIIREGSLVLSNAMTLDIVLVVPSLEYNLSFVRQITSKINCIVTLWPSFCVFQDILTRRTLGCGVKQGKLYYLE